MDIKDNFIIGKKTILCPLQKSDMEYFTDLYMKNAVKLRRFKPEELNREQIINNILIALVLGNMQVWLGITNQGKAYRKIGFIYLTDITRYSCNINGVVDTNFLKGLSKVLDRKGKPSYTEDAFLNMINNIFEKTEIQRIEADIVSTNLLALKICKKLGFKKEGVLRKACIINGELKNMTIMSLLKSDIILKSDINKEVK